MHKQTDGCNCGPFGIACFAEKLNGKLSKKDYFDVNEMRRLIFCLEQQEMTPFSELRRNGRTVFLKCK